MNKKHTDPPSPPTEVNETARIEALSDGLFSIAATLLVLDIKVPQGLSPDANLVDALLRQWPSFLAFLASVATIGLTWMSHRNMFKYIKRADTIFMLLNLLLLLGITFLPFLSALMAEYILVGNQGRVAAVIYGISICVISIFYFILWRYATDQNRLLDLNTPN